MISSLFLVVLAGFLYAAYREVETTLHELASERARLAAEQVAGIFSRSTAQSFAQLQQLAPSLRAYLLDPSDSNLQEARKTLAALSPSPARRITVWDAAGDRMFDLPGGPASGLADAPSVPAPTAAPPRGIGPLQPNDDAIFTELGIVVPDDASGATVGVGSISLRAAVSISPPDALNRLVGRDARILFGNRSGDLWTDLMHLVPGPAVPLGADGVKEYQRADGERLVGALAGLAGTPWVVWVEFSRANAVSGANRFLQRMAAIALLTAIATIVLVRWFTIRVTRPLAEMTNAAEAMAEGDYSRRVAADRSDEIGRLGRAFNLMTTQVADAQHTLEDRVNERTQELNVALAKLNERSHERERSAEARMRFALKHADVGIWDMDYTTGKLQWSEILEGHYGLRPGTFAGTIDAFIEHVHPDDRAELLDTMNQATRSGAEFTLQHRAQRPDGTVRWLSGAGRILRGEHGEPVRGVGILMDVTERRTLEQQYQQAQKMEAIGQLAGGIAHDFNNLLTAILGYGRLVLVTLDANDERRQDVELIIQAGDRAAALTKQLLAFSRKEVVQPTTLNINDVIVQTHKILGRLIGADIEVHLALAADLASVLADPGQVDQILINLAVNARDAMPSGGHLTIETQNVDLDASFMSRHGAIEAGPYVMLAVTDTGVGMDEETRSRLFEPFFTTKERGKGTGLGLATVFGIVKQNSGHLSVYSEPGHGATFKIYLPQFSETDLAAPSNAASGVQMGTETVLLVEDEEAVRRLTHVILQNAGYRVLDADSPRTAEAVIGDRLSEVAVLVTDVIMPGGSGPALFAQLQAKHPRLRVLYMSGYTDDAMFRTGKLDSGAAFLQKPFAAEGLLRKLRDVLD